METQIPEVSMTLVEDIAIRLVTALLIFVIGRWLAKFVTKLVKRAMKKADVEDTLETFLGNLLYYVLLAAVVIATINQLGIQLRQLIVASDACQPPIQINLQATVMYVVIGQIGFTRQVYINVDRQFWRQALQVPDCIFN